MGYAKSQNCSKNTRPKQTGLESLLESLKEFQRTIQWLVFRHRQSILYHVVRIRQPSCMPQSRAFFSLLSDSLLRFAVQLELNTLLVHGDHPPCVALLNSSIVTGLLYMSCQYCLGQSDLLSWLSWLLFPFYHLDHL